MSNVGVEYNTIVMTFGYPVPGREAQAGELYASRVAYLERCKQAGRVQAWDYVMFGPYGGDLAGFFVVHGTHQNLQWLTDDAECQELNLRSMHCLKRSGFLNAFSGKAASDVLSQWAKAARP